MSIALYMLPPVALRTSLAAFVKAFGAATDRAIIQANDSLQPVKVGFGVGTTDVNTNRDLRTPKVWSFGSRGEGGTATMPLQDTFWGARFSMLQDRFGIQWMFNFDHIKAEA